MATYSLNTHHNFMIVSSCILLLSYFNNLVYGYSVGGMDHSGSCTYNFLVWTPNEDIINKINMLETRYDNMNTSFRLDVSELKRDLQSQMMLSQNITAHCDKTLLQKQFDDVKLDMALKDLKLEIMESKGESAKIWAFLNQIQSSMLKGIFSNNNAVPVATAASDGNHANTNNDDTLRMIAQLRNGVGDLKAEWLLIKRQVQASKSDSSNIRSVMSGMEEDTITLKAALDLVKMDIKSIKDQHRHLNKSMSKVKLKMDNYQTNPKDVDWGSIPYDDEIYDGIVELKEKYTQLQEEITNITLQLHSYQEGKQETLAPSQQQTEPAQQRTENNKVTDVPRDCHDIYKQGYLTSGVYKIKPKDSPYIENVYCEIVNETGWTVLQRRQDGLLTFSRMWMEYKYGFGNLYSEFWLGNQMLHWLTSQTEYVLRVDMWDWEGNQAYAEFIYFHVGNEKSKYKLKVRGYSGNAGDSMSYHDEMAFSTHDTDNDLHHRNCANENQGGWWFNACYSSNLNGIHHTGRYSKSSRRYADGIVWFTWKETEFYSLKRTEMKIRPVNL